MRAYPYRNAWTTLHAYAWSEQDAWDLDASSEARGRFGFGKPPPWTCPDEPRVAKATGWRPQVVSFGFTTFGEGDGFGIRVQVVGNPLKDSDWNGGAPVVGARWVQTVIDLTDVRSVYLRDVPIVVDDQTGNVYGLWLTTTGRNGPSVAVLDWQWGRFVRDDARYYGEDADNA